MVLVSVLFLFVNLFGAYAYGAATVFSLRKVAPVWPRQPGLSGAARLERPSLALFLLSTVWFVLHTLIEFRYLIGDTNLRDDVLDLATLVVYLFPPVIMHTVYHESECGAKTPPAAIFKHLLRAMYVVAPAVGLLSIAMIFGRVPRPSNFNAWMGGSIGLLFVATSTYATALMLRRTRRPPSVDQLRLRNVMIGLFIALSGLFVALIFMQERSLLIAILERLAKAAPLYFLVASVYFESRFEFYDLVVKRAVLLLLSVVVLGVYFAVALSSIEMLPEGAARPWLFAVALAPIAMVMPAVMARAERWLDRIWLGREFTPVDAVTHILGAMQPATDEATLIEAAETRLADIFGARVAVLVGSRAIFEPGVQTEIRLTSPVTSAVVRIAVRKDAKARRFLSEDLALLRLLGGVFTFMLENIRLQRRRVEQEQLAHELRLQSSRSELKALRAQINPHFLFNALNAIASLIHTDPTRADEVVEQLAEVFRYTLRRSDSEWAPLDQELAFARAYLDVEQARFGQRLAVTIDTDHHIPAPEIPSMLLQTLIENAVKHGVSQAREAGRIEVIARTAANEVTLEVRNTGPAATTSGVQAREGEGFGLHSVRERLKGHFGSRASFTLTRDAAAGVTVARIIMPVKVAA